MKAMQSSNIKDKNIIANVVNSQSDPSKREQEIRNMTVIYKEIEDNILPPLRRAEIKVNCIEPSLSDQEIAQYATSTPDSLNLNEMLYAATLTTDANAKLNIYKTVIQKYPNDWRGYNNAGFASSDIGDYDGASAYFAKAKSMAANNGIVLNNTGAMASKDKDFGKAKTDYMAAQKQGVDVGYNMGIVKIAEGNYNGAINSFGTVKCDYNLALAHVLSGNYNAATSTLNCAEKTAEVYYLQAIIGARTLNDNVVFENLKKAIIADPSYKETAKEDREFLKYYSNADFQNAIK
jgi:tetratricopeptide (TPR) repeat protein